MTNKVQECTLGSEFSLEHRCSSTSAYQLDRKSGPGRTVKKTPYLIIIKLVNLKKLALKKESEPSWCGSVA